MQFLPLTISGFVLTKFNKFYIKGWRKASTTKKTLVIGKKNEILE